MVGDITFTLENYLSGVLQSSRTLTYPLNVPTSYVPTISSAPFALQNAAGDTIGVYVQNRSQTVCTITASSVYGASIVEYRLTIGDVTYSSASNVITSGVLTQYGVLSGTVTVVDSRGQAATYKNAAAATVYQYFAPMITAFSLLRCTSDGTASNVGTYIKYVLNVVFAPINNLNTKSGTLQFKVAGGSYGSAVAMSAISAYSATVSGVIGAGTIGSAGYVVAASLQDKYSTTTVEAELASSKIWFDLHSSGEGMAIGKPAETPSLFDVGLASKFCGAAQFDVAPTIASSQIATFLSGLGSSALRTAMGIQMGNVAFSVGASTAGVVHVSFPSSYLTAPMVFLTLVAGTWGAASYFFIYYVLEGSVAAAGFDIRMINNYGSTRTGSINWMAVGA
jgi:hypothetical protein